MLFAIEAHDIWKVKSALVQPLPLVTMHAVCSLVLCCTVCIQTASRCSDRPHEGPHGVSVKIHALRINYELSTDMVAQSVIAEEEDSKV
jgi:hypothetical protein